MSPDGSALRKNAPHSQVALELAESNARAHLALLGGLAYGSEQRDGAYGAVSKLDVESLTRHHLGEVAIAHRGVIGTGGNAKSRYLAWDIDDRFFHRVRLLANELERRKLLDYAIGTTGSDDERGKVVLFTGPMPADLARQLAREILTAAQQAPEWGIERDDKRTECRPTAKTGGLLRIGGANPKRGGDIETIFSLATGELVSLSQIGVARIEVRRTPQPVARPPIAPMIQDWLANGMPWPADGSSDIRKHVTYMAVFAAKSGYGESNFRSWVTTIDGRSPWLAEPSPKNRDPRGARLQNIASATWTIGSRIAAEDPLNQVRTLRSPREGGGYSNTVMSALVQDLPPTDFGTNAYKRGTRKSAEQLSAEMRQVEAAIAELVYTRVLHPAGFDLAYSEIGNVAGIPKQNVHRLVKKLVAAKRIVKLDPGTQGETGLKTQYAYPDALALSASRPVVQQRQELRRVYAERKALELADRVVPFVSRSAREEAVSESAPKTQADSQNSTGDVEQLDLGAMPPLNSVSRRKKRKSKDQGDWGCGGAGFYREPSGADFEEWRVS